MGLRKRQDRGAKVKTGCIYVITNTVNGKQYVGQTWDFPRRRSEHEKVKKGYPIYRAMRKYGRDAFTWSILVSGVATQGQLNELEARVIAERGSLVPRGYNLLAGDQREKRCGTALRRQRAGIKRVVSDPAWKAEHAEQLRRMHASPEWRRRHDAAMARNPLDPVWRRKHAEMVARRCKAVRCVETGVAFISSKDAERKTGTDSSTISKVCRGVRATAGGLRWRYVKDKIEVGR